MSQQKPTYAIGFDGNGINAQPMIQTMLEVSAVQITANWHLAVDVQPNVIISEPYQHPQTGQQYYAVYLAIGGVSDPKPFSLPKPFRLMQLIELLNGIEAHFELTNRPAKNAVLANGSWAEFAPMIKDYMASKPGHGFMTLKVDGSHIATIDHSTGNYCRVENFIKVVSFQNTLECSQHSDYPLNAALDGANWFPLENLLWLAGLVGGGGVAAPWLPRSEHYTLAAWPNFALYNHNMKMIELAAKLTKSPMTVATLAEEVDASESMVWNFMNAVFLLGLCKAVDPMDVPSSRGQTAIARDDTMQKNVSSLIGKLKQHLMKVG